METYNDPPQPLVKAMFQTSSLELSMRDYMGKYAHQTSRWLLIIILDSHSLMHCLFDIYMSLTSIYLFFYLSFVVSHCE